MIIYTKHAESRIQQRKLNKSEIEDTILNPAKTILSFRERQLAQKLFAGKILEVVFKKEDNNFIILTAYWLKEE